MVYSFYKNKSVITEMIHQVMDTTIKIGSENILFQLLSLFSKSGRRLMKLIYLLVWLTWRSWMFAGFSTFAFCGLFYS